MFPLQSAVFAFPTYDLELDGLSFQLNCADFLKERKKETES